MLQAVEPHLMRVTLLVPETASLVRGCVSSCLRSKSAAFLVAFVFVKLVQRQHRLAGVDVVELVFLGLVPAMLPSAVMNEPIGAFDKSPVLLGVEFEQRQRKQASRVIPFGPAAFLPRQRVATPRHFDRPCARTIATSRAAN